MKQHLFGQPPPLLFQRGGLMRSKLVGPFPPRKVVPVIGDGAEQRKRVEPPPLLFEVPAQLGGASAPGAPVALLEAVKSEAQRRSLQGQDQIVADVPRSASFIERAPLAVRQRGIAELIELGQAGEVDEAWV